MLTLNAFWFRSLLNKLDSIPYILRDVEFLKEKFQDLKAPIEKIERLDREMGVIQRDLKTAFMRIDEVRENNRHLTREIYRLRGDEE